MKAKLYFRNVDSKFAHPLDYFIKEAKKEGLEQITLYEAIPSTDNFFCWCSFADSVAERSMCCKSECDAYKPNKSGRGTCVYRGKLYDCEDEVSFNVNNY